MRYIVRSDHDDVILANRAAASVENRLVNCDADLQPAHAFLFAVEAVAVRPVVRQVA